jgi:hypothetical protein
MIAGWQKARNLPPTGFLNANQQQALLREAATAVAQRVPGSAGNGGTPTVPGSNGGMPETLLPQQPTLPTSDPTRIQVPVPDPNSAPAIDINTGGGREGASPGLE